MSRPHIYFANSSLLSYLSYSSCVILTTRWNQLHIVRLLIDYVKNKQRKYELSLQWHTNKYKHSISSKIECDYSNNVVVIKAISVL